MHKTEYPLNIENDTIVLLTNSFPYGTGEAFLETEIIYLAKVFKYIYIIPTSNSPVARGVPNNVYILDNFIRSRVSKIKRIFFTLLSFHFYDAIIKDFPKSISIPYLKLNFIWSFNTSKIIKTIEEIIKEKDICLSSTIFYSYWYSSGANALALISNKNSSLKTITRVHRGDLYEYPNGFKTFPYREFSLKNIDKIVSISEDGIRHLEEKYNVKNVCLGHLGVLSKGKTKKSLERDTIHIVSCSYISSLKRVHLIAEIIKELKYEKIKWTHFGEGNDKKLDTLIADMDNHVTIELEGQKENQYILNYYKEQSIDLFINVSTSEGIPVTIMEAMSAAIPVLATNVGGTSEIVKEGYNGFLINKDFDIDTARSKIYEIKNRQPELSENAYNTWEIDFNADKNYSNFTSILKYDKKKDNHE